MNSPPSDRLRRGVHAAAISPFTADGALDAPKLVEYCRYLLGQGGCDAVAPLGTTGEGTSVAIRDRLALPGAFAGAGIASDRVIFGTGSCAAGDAVDLTRAAVEAGYMNVLVLPPFYYKDVADGGLFAYYARLIETTGSDALRVWLYHFPQLSQTPIATGLVRQLRDEFGPVIAGLKDSSGDFAQTQAFVGATGGIAQDFDVYPSSEAFLAQGLAAGCAGVISGSANAFAPIVQAALVAEGGAREAAFDLVAQARALAGRYPLVAAMKRIEAWRSADEAWIRMAPPLLPLASGEAAALRADLDGLERAGLPAVPGRPDRQRDM